MKHMWSEEEIAKLPKDINTIKDNEGNPYFMTIEGICNLPNASEIKECRLIKNGNVLFVNIRGLHPAGSTGMTANQIMASFDIMPEWEKYLALDDNGQWVDRLNFYFCDKANANNGTGTLYGIVKINTTTHKLNIIATGTIRDITANSFFYCVDRFAPIA